jgi:hypothetical protein
MNQLHYIDGIRSLSMIYTDNFVKQLLSTKDIQTIERKVNKYRSVVFGNKKISNIRELVENVYEEMLKNYKNEYIYKNALITDLLFKKYSFKKTIVLNEFKIGKSIADTVFVNGNVRLFEIKTEFDNLNRLDAQLYEYRKAIEKIFIVTETKYLEILKSRFKNHNYGIIELTEDNTLKQIKPAKFETKYFDYSVIFKLLRKEEYLSILTEKFNHIPTVPNTLLFKESFKMIKRMDILEFQKMTFNKIKERKRFDFSEIKNKDIPSGLKYICYKLKLKEDDYNTLFNILSMRI